VGGGDAALLGGFEIVAGLVGAERLV
jgi:hypothetical protein